MLSAANRDRRPLRFYLVYANFGILIAMMRNRKVVAMQLR